MVLLTFRYCRCSLECHIMQAFKHIAGGNKQYRLNLIFTAY